MLHKTKGIVFHTVKYSETSIITKIYTESFGLQTYIINGVRASGPKYKASLFRSLHILDLVIYRRENKNLQRVKEFKSGYIFTSLPFDITKSAIAMFLAEILNKSIKEEESNKSLYHFIEQSIIALDESKSIDNNFHLQFILSLTRHLGFFPGGVFSGTHAFFDMKEGCFLPVKPVHPHYVDLPLSNSLNEILNGRLVSLRLAERNNLLEKILEYYELHLSGFSNMKSHKILHEVISH